jgi:hypothetical protein
MARALQDCPRSVSSPGDRSGLEIRNSSSRCPDWSAAASQRGCFPRPDHVSSGTDGLQYFGRTFGYLRRGGRSMCFSREEPLAPAIGSALLSCARRFSSASFSAPIFSERICVSSSCRSQSSSKSMASRSRLHILSLIMVRISVGPTLTAIHARSGERGVNTWPQ